VSTRTLQIATCETPAGLLARDDDPRWCSLRSNFRRIHADVALLSEMPFGGWVSESREVVASELAKVQAEHALALERYRELATPCVLTSHPVDVAGVSVNAGLVWTAANGASIVHTKQRFPNEEGFYEARWFRGGSVKGGIAAFGELKVGLLICTEVMFLEEARRYGRLGAHVIAVPRAGGSTEFEEWLAVTAAAAITSGCYVVSSRRATDNGIGGGAWVFTPRGELLARTAKDHLVVAAEIDLDIAEAAKREYPCNIPD
jgi:N-carbamoylputrescine amidase